MARDFVAALEAEIAELEIELSADLRFMRLQKLRSVLALYRDPTTLSEATGPVFVHTTLRNEHSITANNSKNSQSRDELDYLNGQVLSKSGRRASSETLQALNAAAFHVANKRGPVPTREILEHLKSLGIEIGGSSPLNNLSAMLSNSDKFHSHGRSGWTLSISKKKKKEIEAMETALISIISRLTDEALANVSIYVEEFKVIPSDLVSAFDAAFQDEMDDDDAQYDLSELMKTFEDLIDIEINDRAEGFRSVF